MRPALTRLRFFMLGLLASACGAIEERGAQLPIDRFSELLLVDPELLGSTGNPDTELPTLFQVLDDLLDADDVSAAQLAWLEACAEESDDAARLRHEVTCRWLHADATNGCDAACAQCAKRQLAPAAAPFRPTAIVYRPDLAIDAGAIRRQGQLRLVYALTQGAGSSDDAPELPWSVIVELPLSPRLTAGAWARRVHALAALRSDLPRYRRALRILVDAARAVDDPAQAAVRVRDAAFADGRLFAFAPQLGLLQRTPLEDTVDVRRTRADALEAALSGSGATEGAAPRVPSMLWADSVDRHSGWPMLADGELNRALRLVSCHGCHADDHSQAGFHVAPGVRGRARVSRFLHHPDDLENDELARREDALRTLLRLAP